MIERLAKGSKTRTARHSAVMNEIIDTLNNIERNSIVIPDKAGVVYVKDGRLVIDLSPMADRINLLNQALGSPVLPL